MAPTLNPGELLVALSGAEPKPGSVVVAEHPGRPGYEMVKRLVALPGERVGNRRLGPDEYWVLGDDPDASTDSRHFGPLDRAAIRGVVRFRYWPLPNAGRLRGRL